MRLHRPAASLALLLALGACGGAQKPKASEPHVLGENDANPYRFHRSIAQSLLRTGQPQEASKVIRRLIALRPREVEPYYLLGRAFVDMGRYDAAEKTLAKALTLDAKYAPAHAMMGVLLDTLGRSAEAEESHQRALRLAPDDAGYRNNLGFSLYLQHQYRRAVEVLEAALELEPSEFRIHNNLGFAYAKLDRLEQAETHFKQGGPPAQASNNMGFVYETRGNAELAYQHFLVAVTQDPLLVPARDNLARVCAVLGRPVPELPKPTFSREAEEPALAEPSQPPAQEPAP